MDSRRHSLALCLCLSKQISLPHPSGVSSWHWVIKDQPFRVKAQGLLILPTPNTGRGFLTLRVLGLGQGLQPGGKGEKGESAGERGTWGYQEPEVPRQCLRSESELSPLKLLKSTSGCSPVTRV